MSILKNFIKWLLSEVIHEIVEQIKEEIQKPSTLSDEKVPDSLRKSLDDDLATKLRDQQNSNPPVGGGAVGK